MIIEELFEYTELAELEKCDALAPLYHVKSIGLHMFFHRTAVISVLSGVCAPPDLLGKRGSAGEEETSGKRCQQISLSFFGHEPLPRSLGSCGFYKHTPCALR
jgi:hypothetical protein